MVACWRRAWSSGRCPSPPWSDRRRPPGAIAPASARRERESRAGGSRSWSWHRRSAARLCCPAEAGWLSRRGSFDERELQRDVLEAARRLAKLSEEHLRGDLAGFLERLPDARELQVRCDLAVVEA